MMNVTFSDQSLLMGDEIADLVIEYAAALTRTGGADTVKLQAYGSDGDKVEATLLLDAGAALMSRTTHSDLPDPDNSEAADYIRGRLQVALDSSTALPLDSADPLHHFDSEWPGR
jgi:hypothetical protein